MLSTKKYEIVFTGVSKKGKGLLFASSDYEECRRKLMEPAIKEIIEDFIVRNNNTGVWDYAWRVLQQMQDCNVE